MAWNDIDERCSVCNGITKKARGFNRQNLKRLFWHEPTFDEVFLLFVLVLLMWASWAYSHDIQTMNTLLQSCRDKLPMITNQSRTTYEFQLPNITIANEKERG